MYLLFTLAAQARPLVAIVVIDSAARDEGYALQLDGWLVEDALPIDVAEGEEVALVDPDGNVEPLGVAMGEAWEVTGAGGEAWMSRLDEDVRTDVIAVRGDPKTLETLANHLDATLVQRGGVAYLSAPEILFDLPWVSGLELKRIDEVRLVRVDEDVAPAPVSRRQVPRAVAPTAASLAAPAAIGSVPALAPPATRAVALEKEVPAVLPATLPRSRPTSAQAAEDQRDRDRERYAGTWLCRDTVLVLHPSGVYQVAGDQGEWTVGAPGVVRMFGPNGALWYRAAFEGAKHCREVWGTEAAF